MIIKELNFIINYILLLLWVIIFNFMESILQEIVKNLTDEGASLESSLLKTKVLAFKIKNEKLTQWVNKELDGYDSNDELPDYRKYKSSIIGTMHNGYTKISNTSIPLSHLGEEMENAIANFDLYQGIASLEIHLKDTSNGVLYQNIPPELCGIINRSLTTNGFKIIEARKVLSIQAVSGVMSTVKSKLLDLLFELENEFELNFDFKVMKENKETVNEIVKTIIYGGNNVFTTGNKNNINVNYTINHNNLDELISTLEKAGVDSEDLNDLKQIIEIETPNIENKAYGPKLKEWMKKLTSKAIDGSWQISIGAAGQLLSESLSQYYGF